MSSPEQNAMEDAAKHLATREYSVQELIDRLTKSHGKSLAQSTVERLVEAGIVSDARAVESLLHKLTERKIVGDAEIRLKLEKLGIGWDEASSIIGTQVPPEIDRALELVARKYKSETPPLKIGRFLYSRGFDESTIESVLENLSWAETE